MAKSKQHAVGRRGFLKRAAAGAAAALTVKPGAAHAAPQAENVRPAAPPASARQVALETSTPTPRADVYTTDRPGSDFMVDVFKSLGIEYIAANPGSSFRGLQESFINYGKNTKPGVAHLLPRGIVGRHGARLRQDRRQAHDDHGARHRRPAARVDGDLQRLLRPRAGLHRARQHAGRRPTAAATSSGYTACRTPPRWCATTRSGTTSPVSLSHFAESAVRAYKISMTPPMEPVVIVRERHPAGRADPGRESAARSPSS